MSVVIKSTISDTLQDSFEVVVKGSPEIIRDLCKKVPHDFNEKLEEMTKLGLRVIAFARKSIDESQVA
jgi:magnesium-transporting ATPase (P-type)